MTNFTGLILVTVMFWFYHSDTRVQYRTGLVSVLFAMFHSTVCCHCYTCTIVVPLSYCTGGCIASLLQCTVLVVSVVVVLCHCCIQKILKPMQATYYSKLGLFEADNNVISYKLLYCM